MSATTPTFSQIKAQVTAIHQKLPHARTIGIHAAGRWTGEAERRDGTHVYVIHQCDSPLAMRVALRLPIEEGATKVLITPLDETDLGNDILLRLAKRRLFQIDSWQIVRSLFQARAVDPRLTRHGWIATGFWSEFRTRAIPRQGVVFWMLKRSGRSCFDRSWAYRQSLPISLRSSGGRSIPQQPAVFEAYPRPAERE